MLEFFRISLSATLCYRRNDPLTRSSRQKQQNVKLNQCQINEKEREEIANDQEVYRIKNVKNNNSSKQQFDKVHKTTPQQQSPQEKLLQLSDKSTTCFVRLASFGTQTTEEWKFKMTIASKATQTPLFTIEKEGINEKSESEEHLKLQAWKDAKFFVTNQLIAQCFHTPNYTKAWRSTANYSSTKS
ncbi:Fructose-bisphosphate aldolase 1, chloroplastic [Dirofilaria immitis]